MAAAQPSLFDRAEVGPVRRPTPPAVRETVVALRTPQDRPADWRPPSTPERVCGGCAGDACFGLGATKFCYHCRPADFLPKDRAGVAA